MTMSEPEFQDIYLESYDSGVEPIPVKCRFTELKPVSEIIPNPDNVKYHPEEQVERIAGAIQENGWRQPIVISSTSGYIIKGEGRYRASQLLKLVSVPIEIQNYDNEDAELTDLVADNMAGEGVSYDVDRIRRLQKKLDTNRRRKALALDKRTQIRVDNMTNRPEESTSSEQVDINRLRQRSIASVRDRSERSIPEMETLPYEHHDYVMFSFTNSRDFITVCTKLGIGRVKFTLPETVSNSEVEKVGIGRVISGDVLLRLLDGEGVNGNTESNSESEQE